MAQRGGSSVKKSKKSKLSIKKSSSSQSDQDQKKKGPDLEKVLQQLTMLVGPTLVITEEEDPEKTFSNALRTVLATLGKFLRCEVGSISFISAEDGKLHGLVNFGYKADISKVTYELGRKEDGSDLFRGDGKRKLGGGITAFVATTGQTLWFAKAREVSEHRAWRGSIDKFQWTKDRKFRNCGILPLKVGSEIIGVLKMENFVQKSIPNTAKETIRAVLPFIALALDSYRRLKMPGEKQYRITQSSAQSFEEVELGDVLLEHLLTSICTSDVTYFKHEKAKEKLAERLPMVLGHEAVAIVREGGLNQFYEPRPSRNQDKRVQISVGHHVVVIPQIPCKKCVTCKGSDGTIDKYGENYCENVKHMASNADGSLRTKFRYQSDLLIRYDNMAVRDELAVLTEPFAQLVQVWRELGFSSQRNGFKLNLTKFDSIDLNNAFSIFPDRFDSYFRIFASDDQTPRTLLRLPRRPENGSSTEQIMRRFSHYALMRRGLFLSALCEATKLKEKHPKVLILGTGPMAFIAALLLREAYGLKQDQVYIYGRNKTPLRYFDKFNLGHVINVRMGTIDNKQVIEEKSDEWENTFKSDDIKKLIQIGQNAVTRYLEEQKVCFDVTLECIGGDATENVVKFAIRNSKERGIIALFGLSDTPIEVDFDQVLRKQLTFKGFYRACRESYFEALDYLSKPDFGAKAQTLIASGTHTGEELSSRVMTIKDSDDLNKAFMKSASKKHWGKVIVRLADTIRPIVRHESSS